MSAYKVTIEQVPHPNDRPTRRLPPRLVEEWRNSAGLLDRPNGPAITTVDAVSGEVLKQEWYSNGQLHRSQEPAVIDRTLFDGRLRHAWYLAGQLHKIDGPAVVEWDLEDNQIVQQEWWIDGKRHREDGPAFLTFRDGRPDEVGIEEFFKRDVQFTDQTFTVLAPEPD